MSVVRDSTVGESQHGLRLDRALGELFTDYSRNFLANLVTEGRVRIDGAPAAKPSQRVESGQRLEIDVPDALPAGIASQDLPLTVLYEDAD
ncbi:MAG: S4 domain-containing protein, partial [Thermoanaerobaculia bacterium]